MPLFLIDEATRDEAQIVGLALDGTPWRSEVAAVDEADAQAVADDLRVLPIVADVEPRRLGWFRRWLLRESLLGNYGGGPS
jgi:hypothetical protein